MKKNVMIRIDEEIVEKAREIGLNISQICENALERAQEIEASKIKQGYPLRTIEYRGNKVTINAKLGDYGPEEWKLEIQTNELDKPLTVELGGMAGNLDDIIRGIKDYYYHKMMADRGVDLTETVSKVILADVWIEIGKWARKHNLDISGEVALIPSNSIGVRGKWGQKDFDDNVRPKLWGEVQNDEDKINIFFSNFWISNYTKTNGVVFRLSSYLTAQYDITSAKTATRYVDLNPNNQNDEAEIRKIIGLANVVFVPDLFINKVRSIM